MGRLNAIRGGKMGSDEYRVLNIPRASVYLTANLNCAANAFVTVGFAGKAYDTDSMWTSAKNTVLTVKTPGVYLFVAQLQWEGIGAAVPAGVQRAFLNKNGVGVALTGVNPVQQLTVPTNEQVSAVVEMAKDDEIAVVAQQSILANELLISGTGNTWLTATLLSTLG